MSKTGNPAIVMPESASWIVNKLLDHGYDAYVTGSCVRDCLLGVKPAEWDITTSAKPEVVKALFGKTIDAGAEYDRITVVIGGDPFVVISSPSMRDFTINAMSYNDKAGLIDLYGGVDDLNRKIIRCVGDPEDRFEEDPLLMLRAIRYAGQLNFDIDPAIMKAIANHYSLLNRASVDGIRMELVKLLVSDHPDRIREAYTSGLTRVFLPEFNRMMATPQNNPHHCYSVGEHTIHALTAVSANPVLRLAILLHDIGKPATRSTDSTGIDHFDNHNEVSAGMAEAFMKRMGFDGQTTGLVISLVANHDVRFSDPLTTGRTHVRKMISRMGPTLFPYLLDVMEADVSAQSDYMRTMKLDILQETRQAYREILDAGDCLCLEDLEIGIIDLKTMGIRDARTMGAILGTLLNLVLTYPNLNQKDRLIDLARKIWQALNRAE